MCPRLEKKTTYRFIKGVVASILFLLTIVPSLGQTSLESIFDQGNQAYNNGEYQQALLHYGEIVEQGKHSWVLYFNMANSYYRLNMVAEANFYYEKARILNPLNEDIIVNSQFAQNMTLDTIIPLETSPLQRLFSRYLRFYSLDGWAIIAIVLGWTILILFICFLWSKTPSVRKVLFAGLSLVFVLWIMTGSTAYHLSNQQKNKTFAIIFSEQVEIYSEPNQRSEIQFYLHEGTKVELLEELQQWQNIRLANGANGWIKNADLRIIR